jgi:hypothetical protein
MSPTVTIMSFAIAFLTVTAVLAAAPRYGQDSRPGFDERPETWRFGALR